MIGDLVVYHQKGKMPINGLEPVEGVWWKTCLRQILITDGRTKYFADKGESKTIVGDDGENLPENDVEVRYENGIEVYRGQAAYRFLLRIICGLDSPMLGETEVFGQFKNLFRDYPYGDSVFSHQLKQWVQALFSDVRLLRRNHLTQLGSQSYGSVVRRHLMPDDCVTFIGAGQLVAEILPWVCSLARKVQLVSRDRQSVESLMATYQAKVSELYWFPFDELPFKSPFKKEAKSCEEGVMILAAPIESHQFMQAISGCRVRKLIDLRGESRQDPIHSDTFTTVDLEDVFSEVQETKLALSSKLHDVYKVLDDLVKKRFEAVLVRPMGWDDLCG